MEKLVIGERFCHWRLPAKCKLRAFATAALLATAVAGHAQDFPQRSIELIVPSSPGAPVDIISRAIAPAMAAGLGKPVVVQNVPGAGGVVGSARIARAPKDGYTIGVASSNIAIAPSLYKLPYDAQSDIAAVTMLANGRMVLAVNAKLPVKDARELLALAASKPAAQSMTYGSQGMGSIAHLEFELFKSSSKSAFMHVPYKGSDGMYTALSAGEIDAALLGLTAAIPLEKSGRIRLIGVMGDERVPSLPHVKTMKEQGLEGLQGASWIAMFAPVGIDDAIMERLQQEAARALKTPEVRNTLERAGYLLMGNSRKEAQATYLAELRRYSGIVAAQNIKASE